MENASKALIIAGAILLAILIISLGIMIYNQASGVVNNNAMSEVEIQQFNEKFTQYEGDRVKGATVNTMLQAVLANNVSADDDNRRIEVTINRGEGKSEVTMTRGHTSIPKVENEQVISTGAIYNVKCNKSTTGGNKGLVDSIYVQKQ